MKFVVLLGLVFPAAFCLDEGAEYYYYPDSSEIREPTAIPTLSFSPTQYPTTHAPTRRSRRPTVNPTIVTSSPSSSILSTEPSSSVPTYQPSSSVPSYQPSLSFDTYPTNKPSKYSKPSQNPTLDPTSDSTLSVSKAEDLSPEPSMIPTASLSNPTCIPSGPTRRPSRYPTPYPTRRPTRLPSIQPTEPQPSSTPTTGYPSIAPSNYPTSITIVYTDKSIFGYDVGSRTANIMVLIAIVFAIVWLGMSLAFCITRRQLDPLSAHNRDNKPLIAKKNKKQKFEEYWGEMDDTANSMTGLRESELSSSSSGGGGSRGKAYDNLHLPPVTRQTLLEEENNKNKTLSSQEHAKIMEAAAVVFEQKTSAGSVEVSGAGACTPEREKASSSSSSSSAVASSADVKKKEKKVKVKSTPSVAVVSDASAATSEIITSPIEDNDFNDSTNTDNGSKVYVSTNSTTV